ncbi:MAG: aminotransferase class V-fold PLP-dependent enzyme [Gemmatimonadaceae bacterium]
MTQTLTTRRTFLGASGAAAATLAGLPVGWSPGWTERLSETIAAAQFAEPEEVARDETFWRGVRQAFALEPGLVNLNHGYSPSPGSVLDVLDRAVRRTNRAPLHFGHWPEDGPEPAREAVRRRAAALLGCEPEELALTRSATEALQIVQLGLVLRPADEVLSTSEDYWAMWNTWQQRVQRDGIIHTELRLAGPHPAPGEVVDLIKGAIKPRTRVLLISHVTWLTGHLLPLADICRAAREKGVLTIVDGAHGPGHVPVDVRAIGCDFYGASGHKWLMGPLGTGFLYARRELIKDVWPLTPAWGPRDDIRKFEWVGGQSTAPVLALAQALTFHEQLGTARKAARFRFLRRRWVDRLAAHPRIRLLTTADADRACGVGAFAVDGIEPVVLVRHLRERHRVLVRPFGATDYDGPPGVRVAPNVFNAAAEVDQFAQAVEEVLRSGLRSG